MDGLQAPAAIEKFTCQPVEQLRMRGNGAHRSKVAARGDDALSKMVLPQPIDDNSGREWMVGEREPLRERRAPAANRQGRTRFNLVMPQKLRKARRDRFFRLAIIS